MGKCIWTKYRCGNLYYTECGRIQGINVIPKQKTCYCGKRIERVYSDKLDKGEKLFRDMLGNKI